MLIIGGIGLFGFALTAGNVISGQYSYIVPLVFFGFEVAGMVIGAVASSLYIVDAYSKMISRRDDVTCTIISNILCHPDRLHLHSL
jgi:hypothetical protein